MLPCATREIVRKITALAGCFAITAVRVGTGWGAFASFVPAVPAVIFLWKPRHLYHIGGWRDAAGTILKHTGRVRTARG